MANNNDNKAIDVEVIAAMWSREDQRVARTNRGGMKIRSLEDCHLRGGNFIFNKNGDAATLSFCFERESLGESKVYGLTVGHLIKDEDPLEKPVFVFAHSRLHAVDGGQDHYSLLEIGSVVSYSKATDSLVFEIRREYRRRMDLLKLAPESGLGTRQLSLPAPTDNPAAPDEGTVVVGYGAQRRGAHGVVTNGAKAMSGDYSLVGDIIIMPRTNQEKPLTDVGDGGTLFLAASSGLPLYFHHVGMGPDSGSKESFGAPFARVMAHHDQLGGKSAKDVQQRAVSRLIPASKESSGLLHFNAVIVEAVETYPLLHAPNTKIVELEQTRWK